MIAGLRSRWRYFRLMWRVFNHRMEVPPKTPIADEYRAANELTLENLAEEMNKMERRYVQAVHDRPPHP